MTTHTIMVVPCYNEAARFDADAFLQFVSGEDCHLLFVNDGSRDETEERLRACEARNPARVSVLSLPKNRGKAEAVRQGLLEAIRRGADIVGYCDADLSTPVPELLRLWREIRERPVDVVLGARVGLLGYDIQRSAVRHYLGRVFATTASLILQLRVYDTQCGAKLFRATPALRAALSEPFLSRWAFDVELIGRLMIGTGEVAGLSIHRIVEVPLNVWVDIPGSKLHLEGMAKTLVELGRIAVDMNARRARAEAGSKIA